MAEEDESQAIFRNLAEEFESKERFCILADRNDSGNMAASATNEGHDIVDTRAAKAPKE